MQRFQSFANWAAAFSQLGHIFCCGLPAIFSVLSLLSGLGIMIAMPAGLEHFHHVMHNYEIPLIITAGFITGIGWVLHFISVKLDCNSSGCCHEPCEPKKSKWSKVLIFSTALFLVNVFILLSTDGCH